jgi:hypothetical protein
MSIKLSPGDFVMNTFIVPVLAATGVFILTLVLPGESTNLATKKASAHQNREGNDQEDLGVEKARILAEKLSSHVSVPTPLN